MPESFDPYRQWLRIPPEDQPPDHYRLLGIDLLEVDPDVIASATDQHMAIIRSFQSGKHSESSQPISTLAEEIRRCLLNKTVQNGGRT